MSDSSWEFLNMENEQLKQLRKFVWIKIAKLRESTNLCVEIRRVGDKQRINLVTWYKFSFDIDKMLNLSNNSSGTVLILLGTNPTATTELCLY